MKKRKMAIAFLVLAALLLSCWTTALADYLFSPALRCPGHLYCVIGGTQTVCTFVSKSRHEIREYQGGVCVKCGAPASDAILVSVDEAYHTWQQIGDYHIDGEYKHVCIDRCTECKQMVVTNTICLEHE